MNSNANKSFIAIALIFAALVAILLFCPRICRRKCAKPRKTNMPEFERDEAKNLKNWWKHSITFGDAATIWYDPECELFDAKTVDGEKRHRMVGHHGSRLITVIITLRAKKIRIISARPSSRKEIREYDETRHHRR